MTAGSGEALRQQLEAAIRQAYWDREHDSPPRITIILDVAEAFIESAAAAARVGTATEIAEAIEATTAPQHITHVDPYVNWRYERRLFAARAREVGGSVPAPKGDQ